MKDYKDYKDLSKTPLVDLVMELTELERDIDLKVYKYNLIILEIYKRFPNLENKEEFRPKILTKDKIDM